MTRKKHSQAPRPRAVHIHARFHKTNFRFGLGGAARRECATVVQFKALNCYSRRVVYCNKLQLYTCTSYCQTVLTGETNFRQNSDLDSEVKHKWHFGSGVVSSVYAGPFAPSKYLDRIKFL